MFNSLVIQEYCRSISNGIELIHSKSISLNYQKFLVSLKWGFKQHSKLWITSSNTIFIQLNKYYITMFHGDLNAKQLMRQLTQNFIFRTLNYHRNNFAFAVWNSNVYLFNQCVYPTYVASNCPIFTNIFYEKICRIIEHSKYHEKPLKILYCRKIVQQKYV